MHGVSVDVVVIGDVVTVVTAYGVVDTTADYVVYGVRIAAAVVGVVTSATPTA